MRNRVIAASLSAGLLAGGLATFVAAQAPAQPLGYGHIHFAVTDPEKAREWYKANLGGMPGETPDRVIFEAYRDSRPTPSRRSARRSLLIPTTPTRTTISAWRSKRSAASTRPPPNTAKRCE